MELLGIVIIIVLIFFVGVCVGAALEDIDIEELLSFVATVLIAVIVGIIFFFLVLGISSFFI